MKKIFLNFILVPKLGTSKMTDGNFSDYLSSIILSIKANANFPNQQASIVLLITKQGEFAVAKGKVKHGPAGAAAAKDDIRAEIEQLLKSLATACAEEVNFDLTKFLTSGFSIREHHSITGLNVPTALKLGVGDIENVLELDFKADEKATYFKMWIGLDTETSLRIETTTTTHNVIDGLTPGVRYYIRVQACGKKGIVSGWSSFVSRIAA